MAKQVKSKQRVAEHGEVFTAEREVKAMCDLVSQECDRIDSRFLEPACGNGNFLAEILTRKLATVKNYIKVILMILTATLCLPYRAYTALILCRTTLMNVENDYIKCGIKNTKPFAKSNAMTTHENRLNIYSAKIFCVAMHLL